MGVKKWDDLKRARFSPKQIEEIDRRADELLLEMNLRQLRETAGVTQEELAERAEMSQSELSKLERRDDHLLSTLRRYVEGLGGELEVSAILDGKRVRLIGV